MARYIAKNIVAAELADQCEIQLSYAIGVAEPTSVLVDTFGTAKVDDDAIAKAVREIFPLTPKAIIDTLGLRKPIFRKTSYHGHFGRKPFVENGNEYFSWEKTDRAADLKKAVEASAGALA